MLSRDAFISRVSEAERIASEAAMSDDCRIVIHNPSL